MDFHQLLPAPRTIDSAVLLDDLGLAGRAPAQRPYVIANFATTADGRATIDGASGPIGDDGDTELFRRLRTQVDAVMAGTGTLRTERYGRLVRRPQLRELRVAHGLAADPPLVIVSRSGAIPLEIPLFEDEHSTVLVFTDPDAPAPPPCAAAVQVTRLDAAELTLTHVLRRLRAAHGVRSLLCEGGPTLMSALLDERLLDELFLTLAPQLAGGGTGPGLTSGSALPEPAAMELAWALERAGSLYLRYALR